MNKVENSRGTVVAALIVTVLSLAATAISVFALFDLINSDAAASWFEYVAAALFVLGGGVATWHAALWTRQEATR